MHWLPAAEKDYEAVDGKQKGTTEAPRAVWAALYLAQHHDYQGRRGERELHASGHYQGRLLERHHSRMLQQWHPERQGMLSAVKPCH